MRTYRHTQLGVVTIAVVLAVAALTLAVSIWARELYTAVVVLPVLAFALLLFGTLTVIVDDSALVCRFGAGLVRKRILLGEIQRARTVTLPWFYGYGYRLTPRGKLYRVSGRSAVELRLESGKTTMVGTDEPRELLRAIARRRPDAV